MPALTEPTGLKKLRLRDWLKQKLDRKEITGLEWINRKQGMFQIIWVHGSSQKWCYDVHSSVFREWAIYTGKYNPRKDKPDPAKMKTNFRCALNALPDIQEMKNLSCPRGMWARRVYKMKPGGTRSYGKRNTSNPGREKTVPTDNEIIELVDQMNNDHVNRTSSLSRRLSSNFPAFETLVIEKAKLSDMTSFPLLLSFWSLAAWNALAVDQHADKTQKERGEVDEDHLAGDPETETGTTSVEMFAEDSD